MDLDFELKCSFMGGLVEIGGSANYLNSREEKRDQVSFVMSYQSQNHTKVIKKFKLLQIF